jgi:hypothetical protein
MKIEDRAFPMQYADDSYQTGLTLRQYYAAKALQGLLSGQWPDEKESEEIARRAFVLADFMVEARK